MTKWRAHFRLHGYGPYFLSFNSKSFIAKGINDQGQRITKKSVDFDKVVKAIETACGYKDILNEK